MTLDDFAAEHIPALEAAGEARHNLVLAILAGAAGHAATVLRFWSLGRPGACALETTRRRILLGELDAAACARLADEVRAGDHAGVVGPGMTALWFADRAEALGTKFAERLPQQILALEGAPRYPQARGFARPVTAADADLFADWRLAFAAEATPEDPPSTREAQAKLAASGNHLMWVVDGAAVSVASIGRRTTHGAVINGVYTPPRLRGRGYAGAAVAAVVEKGYAEGKSMACLYVDRRNPASQRCYAKIGFTPVCEAWHCVRT